jgi:hypothetical protein
VAHGQRSAAQAGIVALFDRRIEGVHVDMDDFANPVAGHDRSLGDLELKENMGAPFGFDSRYAGSSL